VGKEVVANYIHENSPRRKGSLLQGECILNRYSSSPGTERVDQCEKEIIRETLRRHPYKRDAARELGIDSAVLSRKIAK